MKVIMRGDEDKAISMVKDIPHFNFKIKLTTAKASGLQEVSPLHLAIIKGMDELVKKILATEGINLNTRDNLGRSALHLSTLYHRLDISCSLIERCKNLIILGDDQGNTPLHVAAGSGGIEHINLFLNHESKICDIDVLNNKLQTPLHLAAAAGKETAVDLLLQNDANKGLIDSDGYTASQLAYVNFPLLSQRLSMKSPTLGVLAALVAEKSPEVMQLVHNPSYFPSGLIQGISNQVDAQKAFMEDQEQTQQLKKAANKDVFNRLTQTVKNLHL